MKKLFVGNLPFSMEEEDVAKLFRPFTVASAKLVMDRETGRKRGFGFVEVEDADGAIAQLHESVQDGRVIVVQVAKEKRR